MSIFTVLAAAAVFAAGVAAGVFLSESETLTADDLRRLHKFTVDKFTPPEPQ
jgi:hypothetical protein